MTETPAAAAIDHLVLRAETLEAGAAAVEAALGVAPGPGGRHPRMGTWNRLLGLGPGLYLEVIAPEPGAMRPPVPRWFDMDNFSGVPRLSHWVVRCDDIKAALAQAPEGAGVAEPFSRGDHRWLFALAEEGRMPLHDAFPSLIEWQAGGHPADGLPDHGLRLARLEIAHPEPDELAAALAAIGLADPRIEIAHGPVPALAAEIATPAGLRWLS